MTANTRDAPAPADLGQLLLDAKFSVPRPRQGTVRHSGLIPANVHGLRLFAVDRGLEVVALVLLIHGVGSRFLNYALYCGAIAAAVLTLIDLPQPTDYSAEGYRLLWTLCGTAIGVVVMLLAGLLAKRRTAKTPQPAKQPA